MTLSRFPGSLPLIVEAGGKFIFPISLAVFFSFYPLAAAVSNASRTLLVWKLSPNNSATLRGSKLWPNL